MNKPKTTIKPYHPHNWNFAPEPVEAAAQAMIAASENAGRYTINRWRYLAAVALEAAGVKVLP